jgi:hypothetical protein
MSDGTTYCSGISQIRTTYSHTAFLDSTGVFTSIRCLSMCMMFTCNIGRTLNSVNAAYPGAKHAVHGVGKALCTLGAVRIVCGVQAAEVGAIPAGPILYGRCIRCHDVHLRSKLLRVVS